MLVIRGLKISRASGCKDAPSCHRLGSGLDGEVKRPAKARGGAPFSSGETANEHSRVDRSVPKWENNRHADGAGRIATTAPSIAPSFLKLKTKTADRWR
jgi:hypothetical protein